MNRHATLRSVSFRSAAFLAVTLAATTSAGVLAADWPAFRGPTHDGNSAERITWPKDGPKEMWKINVGIGHSAVSVVGDRAYTMGNANDTDTVFSIDVATGKVVWTHSYPCNEKVGIKDYDGPFATPTVANGVVYTLSRKGDVFALDAKRRQGDLGAQHRQGRRRPSAGIRRPRRFAAGPRRQADPERQLRRHGARSPRPARRSGNRAWAPAATRRRCRCGSARRPTWRSTRPRSIDHRRRRRRQRVLDHGAAPADWGQRTRSGGRWHEGVRHRWTGIRRRAVRRHRRHHAAVGTGGPVQPLAHQRARERLPVRPGRQQLRRRRPLADVAAVPGLEDRRDQVDGAEARLQRSDRRRREGCSCSPRREISCWSKPRPTATRSSARRTSSREGPSPPRRSPTAGCMRETPRATSCVSSSCRSEIYTVLKRGLPPTMMPGFHGAVSDENLWSIVNYLRTLATAR